MALNYVATNCRIQSRQPPPPESHRRHHTATSFHHHLATFLSSNFKSSLIIAKQIDVPVKQKAPGGGGKLLLDAFVDFAFRFVDQPLLPSQSNFAPVEELKEAVPVTDLVEGVIPDDFSEGVYIRNGPNPLFGGLKSTESIFGKTSHIWIEGEGMLHALYFQKNSDGKWSVVYNNRHLQTETFKMEKNRGKPSFLPAIKGHPPAILAAYLLNWMRFGKVNKDLSNTGVVCHGGKFYAVAENHAAQEFDILGLDARGEWDINGAWDRPFTAHPNRGGPRGL